MLEAWCVLMLPDTFCVPATDFLWVEQQNYLAPRLYFLRVGAVGFRAILPVFFHFVVIRKPDIQAAAIGTAIRRGFPFKTKAAFADVNSQTNSPHKD